jgi:tripartite ATP-independent transporter DctM subunit
VSWLLLAVFAALALSGVPLAVSLGAAAAFTLWFYGFPLGIVAQAMYTSVNSFLLVAVPLFVLAGQIMERGGLSERIFGAAEAVVGRLRGGLGHVNILASMVFGGISGSAVADVASLGPLEIKAMTERGYPRPYSAALVMVTATLASIVPPSILMIIAAAAAGQSVGGALAGGIGPALLLAFAFFAINHIWSVTHGFGVPLRLAGREILRALGRAVPSIVAPIIILGGMFSGFVTPTEAAGLAVLYTFAVAALVHRELGLAAMPGILIGAGRTAGTVLLILMVASIATYVFTVDGLPRQVTAAILAYTQDRATVMLLMGVVFVVVGMLMEIIAASLILIPVLMPVAVTVGADPLHFVVFLVTGLSMGLATPPVGTCLFATAQISGVRIERLAMAGLPFYAVNVVVLILVALVPEIVLWPAGLLAR